MPIELPNDNRFSYSVVLRASILSTIQAWNSVHGQFALWRMRVKSMMKHSRANTLCAGMDFRRIRRKRCD